MSENKEIEKLPSIMAMQRLMLVTDGVFTAKCESGKSRPVYVERITVRGANMPADKKVEKKDSGTVGPRTIETAKLPQDATSLEVDFSIRMIDMQNAITSCLANGKNDKDIDANEVRALINEFIEDAKDSSAAMEVMLRYAHRILSGSWLWRNQVLSDNISVSLSRGGETVEFDGVMDLDPDTFEVEDYTEAHHTLAEWLIEGLRGENNDFIRVHASVKTGVGSLEVYPSQIFPSSDVSNVSKVLYKKFVGQVENSETILGQAALRDQKIANAIRTIDTWYADEDENVEPIPVEPYGASLKYDIFYRLKKKSGAEILKKVPVLDLDSDDDAKYLIGLIIRGGVFTG